MKYLIVFFTFLFSYSAFSQHVDYNSQKGFVASGYDVVSYFSNKATKGSSKYTYTYDGANYKFASKENLDTFTKSPEKYIPQYGGWCAYAMAEKGDKVSINPKTFEIRNGKLYLFYNAYFNNTLDSWLKEMPDELVKKANTNWQKIKNKS